MVPITTINSWTYGRKLCCRHSFSRWLKEKAPHTLPPALWWAERRGEEPGLSIQNYGQAPRATPQGIWPHSANNNPSCRSIASPAIMPFSIWVQERGWDLIRTPSNSPCIHPLTHSFNKYAKSTYSVLDIRGTLGAHSWEVPIGTNDVLGDSRVLAAVGIAEHIPTSPGPVQQAHYLCTNLLCCTLWTPSLHTLPQPEKFSQRG